MGWQTPKTDWNTNPKSPMAEDFNRIEENIEFLNNDIETKKGVIVDALNTVGIATLISDTHVQIASKIIGAEKTGISITPSTVNQAIPKGIYDTGGGLVPGDPDLISANIKANKNIFGVQGDPNVVDTSPGTAIAADILAPKIAFVDGAQITGSMPNRGTVNQTLTKQGQQYIITAGKHNGDGKVTATFVNLTPGNVKEGVNVGGVVGTYNPLQTLSLTSYMNYTVQGYSENYAETIVSGVWYGMRRTSIRPELPSRYSGMWIGDAVSLTNVNYLTAICVNDINDETTICVGSTNTNSMWTTYTLKASKTFSGNNTVTLDVSSLSGMYYIGVYAKLSVPPNDYTYSTITGIVGY